MTHPSGGGLHNAQSHTLLDYRVVPVLLTGLAIKTPSKKTRPIKPKKMKKTTSKLFFGFIVFFN
jgi:hypothetical protein